MSSEAILEITIARLEGEKARLWEENEELKKAIERLKEENLILCERIKHLLGK